MHDIDPELLAALADAPAGGGAVWAAPAADMAAEAARLADPAARADTFRRVLAAGYFTQYTTYSDPVFAGRVVDWQLDKLAAAGCHLSDLPGGLGESPLARPETVVTRGGRAVSPDFLRYVWYAHDLRRRGALAGDIARVVEVGGGYGGMARVVKRLAPGATVFQVDLPASLVYAHLFLRAEFPDARLVVAKPGDRPADFAGADFVLVPAHRADCLRGMSANLVMNVWSFGELPNEVNDEWFDRIQSGMSVEWLYLLNSFLKRVRPESSAELTFGNWLTRLDGRWRVAGFDLDPPIHRCPYVASFPSGAAVLARRLAPDQVAAERAAARAGFDELLIADWVVAVEADADAFIAAGHHVGRWHVDAGTVRRLWDHARLNGDERAVRLLLAYLRIARGYQGDGFRFKDEFYFRELLGAGEAAREAAGFFRPDPEPVPAPPPPAPPAVTLSLDQAYGIAGALRDAGQLDPAEAVYRGMLDAAPGHGECMFQLGAVAEARGDRAAARNWYTRAYALAPDNPNYRDRAERTAAGPASPIDRGPPPAVWSAPGHDASGAPMAILDALTAGPGYTTDALSAAELDEVRGLITAQYLGRLVALQPELVEAARAAGIAHYHTLPIRFDHGAAWPKETRLLDARHVADFERMGFFDRIRAEFGPSASISHDELNWRVVRPGRPEDVGPVHADKWFWDAGYGYGGMPAGYDRFKIWIGVVTEAGVNGLTVKTGSHRINTWRHHFETRGGVRKPVLDENEADLAMELLPLKSGEMVFFHDELLHGGAVNRGSTCRVSIELTVLFDPAQGAGRRPRAAA